MKADLKIKGGNYAEAIPLCKEALVKDPDSTLIRSRLAYAYYMNDDLDEAITEFNTVLENATQDSYSALHLGLAFVKKEDFGKAVEAWKDFTDKTQPIIEKEVSRMRLLMTIYHSHQLAKKAVADEKNLRLAKTDPNTIAVAYFDDLTPNNELQAFQKALVEMMTTDLAKIESLNVVERMQLQALLEELKMGQTGIVDAKTAPRIGSMLGAEHLIVGSLNRGSVIGTADVVDTSDGKVKGSTTAKVDQKDFFSLPSILTLNTLKVLGMMQAYAVMQTMLPLTTNYVAFIQLGTGLHYLDAGNWAAADGAFKKCSMADSLCRACVSYQAASLTGLAMTKAQILGMTSRDLSIFVMRFMALAMTNQEKAIEALKLMQQRIKEGGSGSCFAADTRVLMADNTVKRIIDIKEGDMVISRDVETGKNVIKKVTGTKNGTADSYYLINGDLKVAPPHPFYMDDGRWVKIADLAVGDDIRNVASKTRIESIEEVHEELKIYNIFVEDLHNFYVLDKDNNYFLVKEQ